MGRGGLEGDCVLIDGGILPWRRRLYVGQGGRMGGGCGGIVY